MAVAKKSLMEKDYGPPAVPRWQPDRAYLRTTTAIAPQAYLLSKSPAIAGSAGNYILRNVSEPPTLYTLGELIAPLKPKDDHIDNVRVVRDYLTKILGTIVTKSTDIGFKPAVSTIPTEQLKKPDLSVTDANGCTFFICEIESDYSWNSTTLRLAIHLSQMLASLRNRTTTYPEQLAGFYFPKSEKECVLKVTVKWDDSKLKFCETHTSVPLADVPTSLKDIYLLNKSLWELPADLSSTPLNYPVTPTYIGRHMGVGTKQVASGQSIVLINERDGVVYKAPINPTEETCLMDLNGMLLESIAFPLRTISFGPRVKRYFVYDLYSPPLQPATIRQHAYWYLRSLVNVVKKLHRINIAHLDIRRENVCMTSNQKLVLIDLDRSETGDTPALVVKNLYKNDPMYTPGDRNWVCTQLDWKQVGLMFQRVFEKHKTDEIYLNCAYFFQSLVETGDINETLLDQVLARTSGRAH